MENTSFCKKIWVDSGCSVQLHYLWVRRRRENWEELREEERANPNQLLCHQTQPISWACPQRGEKGLFSREINSSMDKIHCMAQLPDFSQEKQGRQRFSILQGSSFHLVDKFLQAGDPWRVLSLPSPVAPWWLSPAAVPPNTTDVGDSRFWMDFLFPTGLWLMICCHWGGWV